jgi:hypothetical protein
MTWCMRVAFRITEATNTPSEYVILIAFPLLEWLRERAAVLRCTHISYIAFLFSIIICRLHKLTHSDEAKVTQPLAVNLSYIV